MDDERTPKFPLHAGAEHYLFKNAKRLRKEMTKAETLFWEKLRDRRFLNLKIRRQHPLMEFIADFYCHDIKLLIEIDGEYHEDDYQKKYDTERDKYLSKFGYTTIRFKNEEVENDLDEVLKTLKKLVYNLKKDSNLKARKGVPFSRGRRDRDEG